MVKILSLEEELELVEKAKKDLSAFGALYDYYFPRLYGYIFYMVSNHAETEDVVSQAFEKAMLNIDKYEYKGYRFGAWLFRIAKNIVFDISKAKSPVQIADEYEVPSEDSLERQVEAEFDFSRLEKYVSMLKPEQREVIVLRYIEGYSIKEVSQITDRTEDSIKSAAKRAVAELREKMTHQIT